MRIGIATHNYPPHLGGLETVVRELARGFARDHQVVVVTAAWKGKSGIAVEDGITVHRLPAWHGSERRGVPYATPLGPGVLRAFRALRSCDVLHAHGSLYATTLLAAAARRDDVPFFITEHVGFVPYGSRLINGVQRLAWAVVGGPMTRIATRVIAINSRVHEWLRARIGERALFIPNGVDAVTFCPQSGAQRRAARARLGLDPDDVVGLFVGRAAQKKNLDSVLRFPRASYRLVVCGAERPSGEGVTDLGVLPHERMPEVFAAADFLIHAATAEGFPVAIQEAMASGLPVAVLWDSGYAGSIDRASVTAVDSLDTLGRAAADLATDAARRAQLGATARAAAVSRWSWATTVAQYLALFEAAIGGA